MGPTAGLDTEEELPLPSHNHSVAPPVPWYRPLLLGFRRHDIQYIVVKSMEQMSAHTAGFHIGQLVQEGEKA